PGPCASRWSSGELAQDTPRPERTPVDETGVGLDQGRTGLQSLAYVLAAGDAAHRDERDPRVLGAEEAGDLHGPVPQDRPGQPAGTDRLDLGGRRAESVARDRGVGGDQP